MKKADPKVWLVVTQWQGEWDFVRHTRKGVETIFCSDKKTEAMRAAQSFRGCPARVITGYLDAKEVEKLPND